jgi:hypothetical protein
VPTLRVVVTWAREAAVATEAARVVTVLATETSTWEATAARESAVIHVRDAEDWPTMAEGEAWERLLRVEEENTVALASAHKDVDGVVRKIAVLEGELTEVHRAQEVAMETSRGLSNVVVDVERRWGCPRGSTRSNLRSSPSYKPGALSCALPLLVVHVEESPVKRDADHRSLPHRDS